MAHQLYYMCVTLFRLKCFTGNFYKGNVNNKWYDLSSLTSPFASNLATCRLSHKQSNSSPLIQLYARGALYYGDTTLNSNQGLATIGVAAVCPKDLFLFFLKWKLLGFLESYSSYKFVLSFFYKFCGRQLLGFGSPVYGC